MYGPDGLSSSIALMILFTASLEVSDAENNISKAEVTITVTEE